MMDNYLDRLTVLQMDTMMEHLKVEKMVELLEYLTALALVDLTGELLGQLSDLMMARSMVG